MGVWPVQDDCPDFSGMRLSDLPQKDREFYERDRIARDRAAKMKRLDSIRDALAKIGVSGRERG